MKNFLLFITLFAITHSTIAQELPWKNGKLQASSNGHYLQFENKKPFFWQGDTAWLLMQRLNREEVKKYFEDRKAKGFNVIQVIFYQAYTDDNFYKDVAYLDKDLTKPNHTPGNNPNNEDEYDFWDHADYIINEAAKNGMYVAIAPTWGQLVLRDKEMTSEKAATFASHLAEHYKNFPNIIWINGGSAKPEVNTDIWETIGTTIKKTDPNHLITFHPFGRMQSSSKFNDTTWLDINMFTSGHRNYAQDDTPRKVGEDNWKYVVEDFAKIPARPTIDGEPSFENLHQGLHDHTMPLWTDNDVRRYAYWSVFAGACGNTYGENTVRQVFKEGENKAESGAKLTFFDAIHAKGSSQMQYLKKLMLSRPYFERVNDQSIVAGDEGEKYSRILVSKGTDYLMAYDYSGRDFTVQMGKIAGSKVTAWWYNTKNGEATKLGSYPNKGAVKFNPPGEPKVGNDWVLVLDNAAKTFNKPGVPLK